MKSGLTQEQMSAYQGAVEAVLAVPIAVGLGYWADRSFDTSPIGLGVGAVIGFAAMVVRITRMRRPDEAGDGLDRTTAARPEAAGRDHPQRENEGDDESTDDDSYDSTYDTYDDTDEFEDETDR